MSISKDLIPFYLDGREAKITKIRKACMDPTRIADNIRKGDEVRAAVDVAARAAAAAVRNDNSFRRKIASGYEDDVLTEHGRDAVVDAVIDGQRDELAYSLEDEVLQILGSDDDDDDDDEGEGDEGDDDEEEEEDEEDDAE